MKAIEVIQGRQWVTGMRGLKQQRRKWVSALIYFLLFFVWIYFFDDAVQVLSPWLPKRAAVQMRTPLHVLAWQHFFIVVVATGLAVLTSLVLGSLVHLSRSSELKSLVLSASAIGETIPSAAVIALAVPVLGYGNLPSMLALYLYAILPVVRNVIVGMETIAPSVREAGTGMGMTKLQQFIQLDIPLAAPIILTGIRTALVINVSVATIGATVGAGGFGVPIIAGIRVYDPVMVLQGAVPVIVMAMFADKLLRIHTSEEALS
ncbi:ABC transporter permease [Acidaminobacter hydrogenoformans]|uniref:Osmoprotectant transport system permease protein n=1 Tax=Acidaminobacter hydrogenoformans DSM 2784 TaxID=1120920 RepID=A0A1G5RWE6_9FIRM|nr:ABC transporter permease [Acidaminobacter hydrogenoformans]SCZ78178.1 osmoprotectant transport system permease protein [Acidaminobacter hydrogenoformans DSM 2784]